MKITIKNFTFVFILFTILFPTICLNINAQSAKMKKQTKQEKQEERKVKKFVALFIKSLEKTKDISKIPMKFFVTDFYQRFANEEDSGDIFNDLRINPKLLKKLPRNLRYEFNVLRFNFNILPAMLVKNREDSETLAPESQPGTSSISDEKSIVVFGKFFPSQVFEILKRTKVLSTSFDNNKEINNLSDFKLLLSEMKTVLSALRIYLNKNNLPKADSLFSAEMQEIINQANWSESTGFCGKCKYSCHNLPSNAKYIYIGGFFLRLTILKINEKFKIFDTPVWEDASSRFTWSPCPEK